MEDETVNDDTVAKHVAAGIAWLTYYGPSYRLDIDRIDLDTLDMKSTEVCALAQASGIAPDDARWSPYEDALGRLEFDRDHTWVDDHGFEGGFYYDYAALTIEWVRQLNELRGTTAP